MAAENGADPSWRPFLPLAVGVLWGSRWFCFRRFAQTAAGSRWRSWSTVGTTHTKPDVRIVDTAASARSHLSSWLRKMPSTARPREPAEARAAGLFDRFGQPSKAFHRRSGKTERQGCHPVYRLSQSTDNQTCFGAAPKSPISQAGNEKSGRCAFGMSQLELFKAAAPVPAATFPMAC